MPSRNPITRTTRIGAETRLQDLSSLDRRILDQVDAELVQPLEERVETLERVVAAIERGVVIVMDVDLRAGGRSGVVIVEPIEGFAPDTIGQPVIVQPHVTEADAVLFNATVEDPRRMRLHWFSVGPAPAKAQVVYLIG